VACLIRNSDLKGVKVPGKKEDLVVSLFADDITIYLSSKDSLGIFYHYGVITRQFSYRLDHLLIEQKYYESEG
jgi:hypothetical protein